MVFKKELSPYNILYKTDTLCRAFGISKFGLDRLYQTERIYREYNVTNRLPRYPYWGLTEDMQKTLLKFIAGRQRGERGYFVRYKDPCLIKPGRPELLLDDDYTRD